MKTLILVLMGCLVIAQEGGEPVWYGKLYFKDGRELEIQGDIEVLGEEVRFHDSYGELKMVPAKVVDIPRTQAKNKELAGKVREEAEKLPDDGSIYAKITRDEGKRKVRTAS